MHVLVVEDSPQRRALLSLLLAPHVPVIAATGQAAVDALENGPGFDLIFLDHDLEDEMTGADVAAVIARGGYRPEVIVHSMNPDGVAAILAHLPAARVLPIAALDPRGDAYGLLKRQLLAGDPDWDRYFEMLRDRTDP